MLLAVLTEDLVAVQAYPAGKADVLAVYPDLTWGSTMTADSISDLPRVVVVQETTPPVLEWGQSRSEQAVFVTDHWEQQWTVSEITIQEARARLRQMARGIMMDRVEHISPVELAAFREVNQLQLADEQQGNVTQAHYPLVQAVAANRGITFAAAATYLQGWHDTWNGIADNYVGKYFDVIDRIQSAATVADAHAIYLELEGMA